MNPWLLNLADGTAFFVGLGLAAVACTSGLWLTRRIWRSVANVVALVGAVLIAFSATPLPLFLYIIWGVAFCTAFVYVNRAGKSNRGTRATRFAVATLVGLSLIVCGWELPYRFLPQVNVSSDTPVYVIGDSLSAGTVPGENSWPVLLADASGLQVTNLAQSGAKTAAALAQAQRVPNRPGLVIIEIGGNDLFGATNSKTFEQQLNRLLQTVSAADHKVIMFELPLPPLYNNFGRAQRRQARQHSAQLIPKRQLADVFAAPGATVDGLHFSPQGHEMMARQVQRLIHVE